jgi:hypothetical protein
MAWGLIHKFMEQTGVVDAFFNHAFFLFQKEMP